MFRWIKTRVWPRARNTVTEWMDDDGYLLSAALSYYAALSLFPLLLILVAGVGFFFRFTNLGQDAQQQILDVVSEQVSPEFSGQLGSALEQVQTQAPVSGPIGFLTLLFAAIAIFAQFERIFDRIWDVEQPENRGIVAAVRDALVNRFTAFLLLLGLWLLILVIFIVGMAVSTVGGYVREYIPVPDWLWNLVQVMVSVSLNAGVFTLIYKVLPKPAIQWSEAAAGGVLAALLWEAGRQVLAAFLIGSRYTNAYGVVGSFMAIMLWIYYASTVLFLAAEYVQILCRERRGGECKKVTK